MGVPIKTDINEATRFALERKVQFLCKKRSGPYIKVLSTSIAAENCAWRQEADKVLALPKVGRLVRSV